MVTPDNADLTRHIVYTFKASIVRDWRRGRLLLAGDAAHLMPPFIGQGMCSGIRDAVNLAWKLDLVLRGLADENLFDARTWKNATRTCAAPPSWPSRSAR